MSLNQRPRSYIASLDLGTSKIDFIIGEVTETGIKVVGVGSAPSLGVRQGAVVDIELTVEAIKKARTEAELMSGIKVDKVWLGVGGAHLQAFDSNGVVAIRNKEVDQDDIARVIEAAQAVALPNDRQVLHVLTKGYSIDGQAGIRDPIGMAGVRLECSVYIVSANRLILQNSLRCLEKSQLSLEGTILLPLASAQTVVSDEEKNLGVTVVDIGAGCVHMISFLHGHVIHSSFLPIGGHHFTHDIAMGLRTHQTQAESIKRKLGCAIPDLIPEDQTMEVDSIGGRQQRVIPQRQLASIIEARAEESLTLIRNHLHQQGVLDQLSSGIVLTGGAAQLRGFIEMAEYIFDCPIRIGLPIITDGLKDVVKDSSHAAGVGMLFWAYENNLKKRRVSLLANSEAFKNLKQKIKNLFLSSAD